MPKDKGPVKAVPSFGFLPRDGHEKLYKLEERAHEALSLVATHRKDTYAEDYWNCAVPEVIHNVLDMYQPSSVKPAVLQWIRRELDPMLQRFTEHPDWELLDELKALIADIESRFKRS